MEEREVRVGVAGAGFIGAVHARSAQQAGATLAGVADSSPERVEAAARGENAAVMQFKTEGGAMGTTVISQISAGRKNRLWLGVDAVDLPAREPMEVAP
jgi:threonine dehydrogenase-like Zn-dependent dehydrogenase